MKNSMKDKISDFTIIFIVAIALIVIYCLPDGVKESLILHRDYVNFYDLLTTHFVHEDFSHLLLNMVVYLGAALLLYFFLSALNERRLFYKLFVINCLIMPFILSFLWVPVNRSIWTWSMRCFGFSGIVSAFLGSLIAVYMLFLHKKLKVNTLYTYMSAISLTILIFVLIYFVLIWVTIVATILLLSFFTIAAFKTIKSINPRIKSEIQEKIKNPTIAKLFSPIILCSMLYMAIFIISLSIFPARFIQENSTINIFIHYAGFIIGLHSTYMYVRFISFKQ